VEPFNKGFDGPLVPKFNVVAFATRTPLQLKAPPWPRVRAAARERGLRLTTADSLADDAVDPRRVLLIADGWTSTTGRLTRLGARPAVLLSFDPPVVAWSLYYHLEQISAQFPHTFLFEGARDRVAPTSRFHPLYCPVPCPPPRPTGLPWSNRRFMVAMCDNAAIPSMLDLPRWFDRPREVSLGRAFAGLRYRPIRRDRYQARLRALEAFAIRDDFDLYGDGWDHRHPAVSRVLHQSVARAYRGPIRDTLGLLARYRFALIYESTRFPGYVTDSILQCFFARCIPIYSGAPDIAQYVPPAAFIDVRQFQSFPELERFLARTTEDDARRYVDAAHAFLISPAFESWCIERFARDLVEALVHVAAGL
jgi:hypothetical protein